MLVVAVYLCTAGHHLFDPRDTQYGDKVTCHFLMVPTGLVINIHLLMESYGLIAGLLTAISKKTKDNNANRMGDIKVSYSLRST